eukprot:ctg_1415.g278
MGRIGQPRAARRLHRHQVAFQVVAQQPLGVVLADLLPRHDALWWRGAYPTHKEPVERLHAGSACSALDAGPHALGDRARPTGGRRKRVRAGAEGTEIPVGGDLDDAAPEARSQLDSPLHPVMTQGQAAPPWWFVATDEYRRVCEWLAASGRADDTPWTTLADRCLLLYGARGCGKTELARQACRARGLSHQLVSCANDILGRAPGEAERLLCAAVQDARADVVILDEVEAVFAEAPTGGVLRGSAAEDAAMVDAAESDYDVPLSDEARARAAEAALMARADDIRLRLQQTLASVLRWTSSSAPDGHRCLAIATAGYRVPLCERAMQVPLPRWESRHAYLATLQQPTWLADATAGYSFADLRDAARRLARMCQRHGKIVEPAACFRTWKRPRCCAAAGCCGGARAARAPRRAYT